MPWNSTFPVGTVSVKANKTVGQQNTSYIETTMGNSIVGTNTVTTRDHFWNVGSNEDGRHRFMQSPAFTVGGNPADPLIGTGMDGVRYLKTTSGQVLGFYRNASGIFQDIPNFKFGTVNIPSSGSVTVTTVPANVIGEIVFWRIVNDASPFISSATTQNGIFVSNNNRVEGFSMRLKGNSTSNDYFIELGNSSSGTLDLKASIGTLGALNGIWNYRITYRAI